jgi:hypothetical protein
MPVLRLVHAAQANIQHWIINNGYSIRNGGLGNVIPIQAAQIILNAHAVISNTNRVGEERKSSLAQLTILVTVLVI